MEGSWFERDDHPLLNHLVLTTVFEYVHGLDFQSCRLVCKTWSIATLPLARSRLQVTIENMADLESFVKLMRTSTIGIPFGKFRLGSFDPLVGYGQEFVELCGNTAIEYIWIDEYSSFVEDISAFLLASPMLESFKLPTHMSSKDGQDKTVKLFQNTNSKLSSLKSLDIGWDWPRNRRKIFPTLYEELIGAAKNISSFNLTLALTADKNSGSEGVEILKILEKFGREKSVKNLKLPVVTEEISEVLRRMVFKRLVLKHLGFVAQKNDHSNFDWVELVQLFKDNLISLHITIYSSFAMPIIFPILPKLKILQLDIYGESRLSCKGFNHTFPVLQNFVYVGGNTNRFHNVITGQQDSSTMKSLKLGNHPKVNIHVLNQVLTVFPALNDLNCAILQENGIEVIRKIWTHMSQLQVLKISCPLPASENLDSLVTGIPVDDINKFHQINFFHALEQMEMEARTEEILTQINTHRKYTSIGNLTSNIISGLPVITPRLGSITLKM